MHQGSFAGTYQALGLSGKGLILNIGPEGLTSHKQSSLSHRKATIISGIL